MFLSIRDWFLLFIKVMDVSADGGDILPCGGLLQRWVGESGGSSLLDWSWWPGLDKTGQSEDGEMSGTVLREEQGKALIAEFCSQSLPLYPSEGTVEAEDRETETEMWGVSEGWTVGMRIWIVQMAQSGQFLYASQAKFPQLKLSFSSRNSHPDTAIKWHCLRGRKGCL